MKFDDEKFLIRRFVVVVAKLFDLLKKGVLKQHSDNCFHLSSTRKIGSRI